VGGRGTRLGTATLTLSGLGGGGVRPRAREEEKPIDKLRPGARFKQTLRKRGGGQRGTGCEE